MSNPDIVPPTDPEIIKAHLHEIDEDLQALNERMNRIVDGVNNVGSQVQWIVDNVQGLFQFLNSPQMMSLVSGKMMGNLGSMMEEANAGTGERPEE